MVNTVPVDGYGADRAGRAEVLARSAADALLLVDRRDSWALIVPGILPYHADRSDRAVAGAVAAPDSVTVDNAEVVVHARSTHFPVRLFLRGNLQNSSRRAYLGTFHALRTAVALLE